MSKKEEIQQEVNKIAELMRPLISFDDAGQATLVDSEVFAKNLPEGITAEQVTQLGDYTRNFIAGTTAALDVAIPKFVENPNLERMKLTVPMVGPHNNFELVVQREFVSRNPRTGEEGVKNGHVTLAVNQGFNGSRFDAARALLKQQFTEALAENK